MVTVELPLPVSVQYVKPLQFELAAIYMLKSVAPGSAVTSTFTLPLVATVSVLHIDGADSRM